MRKKMAAVLLCSTILFTGCGKTGQVKETKDAQDSISTQESEGKTAEAFPENYKKSEGNVTFDLQVHADIDPKKDKLTTAEATLQKKVAQDTAAAVLCPRKDIQFETETYEDEYEKDGTEYWYEGEDFNYSYEPKSSAISYSTPLYSFISKCFQYDPNYEGYNADLYSDKKDFSFMTQADAEKKVIQVLKDLGFDNETEVHGYALDHTTMAQEENTMGNDGNQDESLKKTEWTAADDCYYFCVWQKYQKLPVYHLYADIINQYDDSTAPVQVVWGKDGLQYLHIEDVFAFEPKKEVTCLPFEDIASAISEKYNELLGTGECHFTDATLTMYVEVTSTKCPYEATPVWVFQGIQKAEEAGEADTPLLILVDAATGKEVVPCPTYD
ncbi:MAG: hypothetical protein ACI4HI_07705 [Lachnospiraceae bacterium]